MSRLVFPFVAAVVLGATARVAALSPLPSALAFVGLGVALATAASGAVSPRAIGAGAIGALAAGVLGPVSAVAAGAALALAAFAERTARVRTPALRAGHLAGAGLSGAFAGHLAATFDGAALPVHAVAVAVGAASLALPLLVEADDALAAALLTTAKALGPGDGAPFVRAAELRRAMVEMSLASETRRPLDRTFDSLAALGEVKVRLVRRLPALGLADPGSPRSGHAVKVALDTRIDEHVALVERAVRAVAQRTAAAIALEAQAIDRAAEAEAEALEDEADALARAEA